MPWPHAKTTDIYFAVDMLILYSMGKNCIELPLLLSPDPDMSSYLKINCVSEKPFNFAFFIDSTTGKLLDDKSALLHSSKGQNPQIHRIEIYQISGFFVKYKLLYKSILGSQFELG
jgi:hypothetical protein